MEEGHQEAKIHLGFQDQQKGEAIRTYTHEWRNSGVKDAEYLAKGATLTENTRSSKVPRVEH